MEIEPDKIKELMGYYVECVESKQTARAAGVKWAMFVLGIANDKDIHNVLTRNEAKKERKVRRMN